MVIVCGEFNSGVQIQSLSEEHEQVFTVKKISQYPHYNPKRVSMMITSWPYFGVKLSCVCLLFTQRKVKKR